MTTTLPQMFRVRQLFDGPRVDDVPAETERQLAALNLQGRISPGQSVAVTCGSRGIANIHLVIKAIAAHLQGIGAEPFVVPAMGSHGGGTAEGQRSVIASYGVTEAFVGCPIRSSMETVVVCDTVEGFPVHFDRNAYQADHVVVCNRVKPHTNFVGEIESGLMKMMLIGLGKHAGAKIYHRAILDFSFGQIVRSVGRQVLDQCSIVAGVALVENSYDETARIAAVGPEDFEEREKELLVLARGWMPRLLLSEVDLLLIDKIGKNISGTGMDTNVIGRKFSDSKDGGEELANVRRIVIRGLTPESHGNATGIGLADFCKTRLVEQMDVEATQINCLTGGSPSGAKVPIHYETDRQLLEMALPTIGLTEPQDAKVQWIQDTLHLREVECSAAYLEEAQARDDLEILTELRDLPLDEAGNLPDWGAEPAMV
ncbi:MAG: DUF2088 domain-containing protein [Planctomycetes bacterium]|nr:DUF2088 domain-containing protein [Planctomycetota bacterium]